MVKNSVAIVAIAKNEGRYIEEWVRYHLSIGFDRIFLFDNESTDDTYAKLLQLSHSLPIDPIYFPSPGRKSPQKTAYNRALKHFARYYEWALVIDIDEFFVPWGWGSVKDYLAEVPDNASSVAVNWRTFGSSRVQDASYGSVLKTFTRCSSDDFLNDRHFKSFVRVRDVSYMDIHHGQPENGDVVNSVFERFTIPNSPYKARDLPKAVYNGVQINHYQCKTYSEFKSRMLSGNPNVPPGHERDIRDFSMKRFNMLDTNNEKCERILQFVD